jgi:galactonate dehydratase
MASIPNALMLERVVDDWLGRNAVITRPPDAFEGALGIPDQPGLGVDIVEEQVARYPSTRNVGLAETSAEEGHSYVAMRRRRSAGLRAKAVE